MGLLKNIFSVCQNAYKKEVARELNMYGLRFQDLLVETPQVSEAIRRLPPEEQLARERRIKRAIEIGFKKKYLPPEIQKLQDPFKPYLTEALAEVEREESERKLLNP